ncbi:hypothetical protein, partial [Streptococcus pneumoniae]|uniref:hypothetical protein n=1 Tax=Streptococcus pneumoniae TaxID=1313 RepID=UPI001F163514
SYGHDSLLNSTYLFYHFFGRELLQKGYKKNKVPFHFQSMADFGEMWYNFSYGKDCHYSNC